jgi:hypothetical protein
MHTRVALTGHVCRLFCRMPRPAGMMLSIHVPPCPAGQVDVFSFPALTNVGEIKRIVIGACAKSSLPGRVLAAGLGTVFD